jgi:hypothetical protein
MLKAGVDRVKLKATTQPKRRYLRDTGLAFPQHRSHMEEGLERRL